MNEKKNTYEVTDLIPKGGKKYGSNIHGESIHINTIMWDMIKILNKNNLFGFHIISKISTNKTFIILYHRDKEKLEEGKKLLHNFKNIPDTIFLAKIKQRKNANKLKRGIIFILLSLTVSIIGAFLYLNKNVLPQPKEKNSPQTIINSHTDNLSTEKNLENKIIKIDIKTLKILQKDFIKKEKNSLEEKITKSLELGVDIISSLVPEEQKNKYNNEELLKNFKGKTGIKFELIKEENSKDFNMNIKELNQYAMNFIKNNKNLTLLKNYNHAIKYDKSVKKNDLMVAQNKRGELYGEMKELKKAEKAFLHSLKLSQELAKKEPLLYNNAIALNLSQLALIHQQQNKNEKAKKELNKAEEMYLKVVDIYRKIEKKHPEKIQSNLAWSLNMLANFYQNKRKDFKQSIKYRKEAIKIYLKLSKIKPNNFKKELFKSLNSLAKSYTSQQKLKLAKHCYHQSISLLEKSIKEEKNKDYIIPLATAYNNLAGVNISEEKFLTAHKNITHSLKLIQLQNSYPKNLLSLNYAYLGYYFRIKNDLVKASHYTFKSFKLNKRFKSARSYIQILIKENKKVETEKFFKEILEIYREKNQQVELLTMYGKFLLKSHPKNAKRKLHKALKLHQSISKDNNSTEYNELIALIENK